MEKALNIMQEMVNMINRARENNSLKIANEHLDILCGAMCVFNEYERKNGKQVALRETNNRIWIQIIDVEAQV